MHEKYLLHSVVKYSVETLFDVKFICLHHGPFYNFMHCTMMHYDSQCWCHCMLVKDLSATYCQMRCVQFNI